MDFLKSLIPHDVTQWVAVTMLAAFLTFFFGVFDYAIKKDNRNAALGEACRAANGVPIYSSGQWVVCLDRDVTIPVDID